MRHMLTALGRLNAQQGQALAEYGLILAFIAMACLIALGLMGLAIGGFLDSFAKAFPA